MPKDFEATYRKALLAHGYSDEEVGKVMGGNFFSLWQEVTRW